MFLKFLISQAETLLDLASYEFDYSGMGHGASWAVVSDC
jgi:hypothetical protein